MGESSIPQLLTTDDVAAILQVSKRTLESWRTRDEGPRFLYAGKHVWYRPVDVETWIEESIPYSLEDARERGLIPKKWRS
ncbi:hypothetical protein QFZ53_002738 [Microbacterium natoriense]|uniref:Helix-turn-helix domain-containing protein n=1 Tax=Microbacterium natoriense TaxID=284570 RepID=A0AAW8F1X5_9MICO|nr:helix-turn-helix domain-containing protein [Microbacterium natoriense]MDQ0648542.1 hypothetical protein [Microbacterium natoriense]